MSDLAIQGTNARESQAIALAAYKVNLLKTITTEGEYSVPVEPYIPVKFMYSGPTLNGQYNRIGFIFRSGSSFLIPNEYRVLGMLVGSVSNVTSSGNCSACPWFEIIPTEPTLKFAVVTTSVGIAAMSVSGIKAHIFQ